MSITSLFPVLLFQSIVKTPLDLREASSLIAAGLLMTSIAIGLSYSLPHLPLIGRHLDRRDHAASTQVAFRSTPSSCWRWPNAWPARAASC